MEAAADIRFDFDGALNLARRLWTFATEVDTLGSVRAQHAQVALSTWQGVFGTQFGERINAEITDLGAAAGELRTAANAWATAWALAMNEQNRRLFARRVTEIEDDRSVVDDVVGFFGGHDDLPPEPSELGVPQAPAFAATGSLVRY
jgi:hypothetical protein